MRTSLFAGMLFAVAVAPAVADRTEDDLQAVKKAVGSSAPADARPAAEEAPAPRIEAPSPRKGEPQWFRVRIKGKAGRHAKVEISLPLGLVRSFGDDWPVGAHDGCRKDRHCPTLGEILRALGSGQSLVEIDSDDSTARVWVE